MGLETPTSEVLERREFYAQRIFGIDADELLGRRGAENIVAQYIQAEALYELCAYIKRLVDR